MSTYSRDEDRRQPASQPEAAPAGFEKLPISVDREATDESLKQERNTTDVLIADGGSPRIDEVVHERREEATQRLQELRRQIDSSLEDRLEALPQVSSELERVAESMSTAAESLGQVADTLKESFGTGSDQGEPARTPASDLDATMTIRPGSPLQARDVVSHVAHAADGLRSVANDLSQTDTAETRTRSGSASPKDNAELASRLTSQLAEIAKGMADVSATLAEERRDVDDTLRHEREVTDRIIVQEIEQVEADLAETLDDQQQELIEKRQITDEDLAKERRDTDEAVDQVLSILSSEEQARARSERKFATRNEFLAIVSHDLRAPLMGIIGAAQMIEHAPASKREPRIGEWTTRIRRSAAAMERLILDLLEFGSLEDGQLRVVAERLDVAPAVRTAIDALQSLADAKSLSIVAELPPEPVMAHYDTNRLQQVLSNLIHNAIKFTPEGGTIRIRISRIGSACHVSIADTGTGIPEHELDAIFECFYHGERADYSGLGLGLYIARWIVEAHGGRLWAESRLGGGSTFYFTLPAD